VIDRIQDFGELMCYFRGINELLESVRGELSPQNEALSAVASSPAALSAIATQPESLSALIKKAPITDVALEASARLFYSGEEAALAAAAVHRKLSKSASGSPAYPSIIPK
jgi:hypothetical protein